jgi:hypothetical protein
VFKLPHVDVGEGWLIFGLPPAEVAVHPSEKNDVHELYLMCDDIETFVREMRKRGVACGPVQDEGWGLLTQVTLPAVGSSGCISRGTPGRRRWADGRRRGRPADGRRRGPPDGLSENRGANDERPAA